MGALSGERGQILKLYVRLDGRGRCSQEVSNGSGIGAAQV